MDRQQYVHGWEKMIEFSAVVFDFDYTLADSSRGAVECVNYALIKMGLECRSRESICKTIGLPLPDIFKALTGHGDPGWQQTFCELFLVRADQVMADMTFVFAEAREAVTRLFSRSFSLGICSTKYRRRIVRILKREGLLDFFAVIVGGEDVRRPKPNPEGLRMAVQNLNHPSGQCLYVGDSVTDAETARRANIPFAAVLSGTTARHEFYTYRPLAVLDSILDLPEFLERDPMGENP